MSYRPISDSMILARPKLKPGKSYYGAYPAGFPERARIIIGAGMLDPVLHVCGGHARHYLYPHGFGVRDKTLDIDPLTEPDYCQDARDPWPLRAGIRVADAAMATMLQFMWKFVIADPPYSREDAGKYRAGAGVYPTPCEILKRAYGVLAVGGRIGILHYQWVQQPRGLREKLRNIGIYPVLVGQGNKLRGLTVFEKVAA